MKHTKEDSTRKENQTWLGIDFGTVCCSAALAVDGEPSLVPVASLPRSHVFPTLAYVPKNNGPILTCHEAESQAANDPTRVLADFKFDIADDSPVLPGHEATRLDLVTAILRTIKAAAEKTNRGQPVTRAVITIPAYLDADKRTQAMSLAGRAAGFEEVKLLAEPKAAAIYYGYRLAGVDFAEGELTLVYDLGGSTFNPTLIRRTASDWEAVEMLGDRGVPCAGLKFDQLVIDHLRQEHPSLFPDAAFEQAEPARAQERRRLLKKFCQQAKHTLSAAEEFRGLDPIEGKFEYVLTRARFNQLIEEDLEVTLTRCNELMNRKRNGHEIGWKNLKRVLLVGGSCNIPRVGQKLGAFLAQRDAGHVHVCSHDVEGGGLDPNFAVALGAVCSVLGAPTRRFMDAATYQRFRQELVALLEHGIELLAAPAALLAGADSALLRQCQAKLLEDRFTIAIVGEFQGGKSTTFNTLCDGRLLSPVGIGSKTSGCRVSAHALKDPKAPERALVEWRSPAELIAGFDELLLPHLQRLDPGHFASCNAHLDRFLNLNDPQHRALLKQAVLAEMQHLQRERKGGADVAGREEICDFALLVAELYGCEDLKRLQTKTDYRPEDIADLVTFPKEWNQKRPLDSLAPRAEGQNTGAHGHPAQPVPFATNEVVFAFVKKVSLFIHSENLSRIGSVPIDLPGLFASRWDSAVATEGMSEADAILYLFDGSKTIKESDLAGLREMQNRGWGHKLFYGWNMRSKTLEVSKLLAAESKHVLRKAGFKVSDQDFFLFHAPLALGSLQLKKLLQGRLEEATVQRLSRNGETASVALEKLKGRLIKVVDRYVTDLDPEGAEFSSTDVGVDSAHAQSGLPNLMSTLESFSTRNKAEFVLVNNGAKPIVAELESLEGSLENIEREPDVQDSTFRTEFAEAEAVLGKFEEACDGYLKDLEHSQPDHRLADDFCAQFAAKRLKDIAQNISIRIKRAVIDDWWFLAKSVFDKAPLEAAVAAICRSEMERAFAEELTAWIESLKAGRHEIYNQELRDRVLRIQRLMQESWQEANRSGLKRLKGISVRTLDGNIAKDLQQTNTRPKGEQPDMQNVAMAGAFLVGGILAAVTLFVGFIFSNPAGWFTGLVGIVVSLFWGEKADEWLAEKIASKVHGKMSEAWPRISQDVKSILLSECKGYRDWYHENLRQISREPRAELKARQSTAEMKRRQSRESLQQDAAEARRFRETLLAPSRQELEGFIRRCRQAIACKP